MVNRLLIFYRQGNYFRQLLDLALPIAFQHFIFSLLNMVSYVLVGQKGDAAVAAVGVAGQVSFLLAVILFGLGSGAAMLTAQLWGKRDTTGIRKVLAISLWISLGVSSVFLILSEAIPEGIATFYSSDPQVISLAGQYLRIAGPGCIFFAITSCYASILRSIGNVKLPAVIGVSSLIVNIVLSYGLLFGKLGLPELGVPGTAWALLISRASECLVLLTLVYAQRSPIAASFVELKSFDRHTFAKAMHPILPVILNEVLWSLAVTTYNAVYGHISTEALAAVNILSTVDNLAIVVFMGLSSATAVLVGHKIGAGEKKEAHDFAVRSLGLGLLLGILIGAIVLATRIPVLRLYRLSEQALEAAYHLLTTMGSLLWLRMMNMVIIIGALRGGGDTRFALVLDGFIIWIVGVPMALLGGFVLHLPVYWVYLMVMAEEVTKWGLGLWRFFSRRWIHDWTQAVSMAGSD